MEGQRKVNRHSGTPEPPCSLQRPHLLRLSLLIQVVIEPHRACCADRQPQQVAAGHLLHEGGQRGRCGMAAAAGAPPRLPLAATWLAHHAARQSEEFLAPGRGGADGSRPVGRADPRPGRRRRCSPHCCSPCSHCTSREALHGGFGRRANEVNGQGFFCRTANEEACPKLCTFLPSPASLPSVQPASATMSMRARSLASLCRRAAASLTQRSPTSPPAAAGVSWGCWEARQLSAGRPRPGLAGSGGAAAAGRRSSSQPPLASASPATLYHYIRSVHLSCVHVVLGAGAGAPGGDSRRRGGRRRWGHDDEGKCCLLSGLPAFT